MDYRDIRVWVIGQLKRGWGEESSPTEGQPSINWTGEAYRQNVEDIVYIAQKENCNNQFRLQHNQRVTDAIQQARQEALSQKGNWNQKEEREENDASSPGIISQEEWECARAASLFLRWKLNQRPDVKALRAKLPRLLTEEEAYGLLINPLAGLLGFQDISKIGVSLTNLQGEMVRLAPSDAGRTAFLRHSVALQDADNIGTYSDELRTAMRRMELANLLSGSAELPRMNITVEVTLPDGKKTQIAVSRNSGSIIRLIYGTPIADVIQVQTTRALNYRFPNPFKPEDEHEIAGYAQSVVGEILALVDDLRGACWWNPFMIAAYLLTGLAPPLSVFRYVIALYRFDDTKNATGDKSHITDPHQSLRDFQLNYHNTDTACGPVYLEVQPWVTATTLSKIWSAIVKRIKDEKTSRQKLRATDTMAHFCTLLDSPMQDISRDRQFERALGTVFPQFLERRIGVGSLPPKKKRGRPKKDDA